MKSVSHPSLPHSFHVLSEHTVIGASTTQLFMNLSSSLQFPSGSEIILSRMEHETNVKPWLLMAERLNLTIKWWESSKEDRLKLTPENLKPLLSEKVKFVACTHVSNILGTIHDVKAIADTVHEAGALFCVDGVSYAPHRSVDVKAFGVDFYSFSWYKVCLHHDLLHSNLRCPFDMWRRGVDGNNRYTVPTSPSSTPATLRSSI
jgi:selenocysteine lyase/cysteine desulfurase